MYCLVAFSNHYDMIQEFSNAITDHVNSIIMTRFYPWIEEMTTRRLPCVSLVLSNTLGLSRRTGSTINLSTVRIVWNGRHDSAAGLGDLG